MGVVLCCVTPTIRSTLEMDDGSCIRLCFMSTRMLLFLKICLQECSYYFYILIPIGVYHNSNFMEIYFH